MVPSYASHAGSCCDDKDDDDDPAPGAAAAAAALRLILLWLCIFLTRLAYGALSSSWPSLSCTGSTGDATALMAVEFAASCAATGRRFGLPVAAKFTQYSVIQRARMRSASLCKKVCAYHTKYSSHPWHAPLT